MKTYIPRPLKHQEVVLKLENIKMSLQSDKRTGYPSIDKPWIQFYSKEELNVKIPEGTMFDYLYELQSYLVLGNSILLRMQVRN